MRRWFALGLLLSAFGCGTSLRYSPTEPPPRKLKKRSPQKVAIYVSSTPPRSYVEIGILEAQEESGWSAHDIKAIIGKMREAAGNLGCDALIILGSNDAVTGSRVAMTTLKGYRASCIVYRPTKRPGKKTARVARRACVPGSTQLCHGPAACQGAQACLPDGSGFGPCDCGTNADNAAQTAEPTSSGSTR